MIMKTRKRKSKVLVTKITIHLNGKKRCENLRKKKRPMVHWNLNIWRIGSAIRSNTWTTSWITFSRSTITWMRLGMHWTTLTTQNWLSKSQIWTCAESSAKTTRRAFKRWMNMETTSQRKTNKSSMTIIYNGCRQSLVNWIFLTLHNSTCLFYSLPSLISSLKSLK